MANGIKLQDMIGEQIIAHVPIIDKVKFQVLTLHAVETGGIWIENQTLTDLMLEWVKQISSTKTPVFFLPYHQIGFVLGAVEKTSLNEKAFGV